MNAWKSLGASLVVVLGVAGSAGAQGAVPGGWSPRFGYQSLGGVAVGTGVNYGGYGYGPVLNTSPYGPYGSGAAARSGFSGYAPPPGVVNGLGPLGDTIRRSTRSRRGR